MQWVKADLVTHIVPSD
nr:hypothetical protein [Synechococcus sp. A15-44]